MSRLINPNKVVSHGLTMMSPWTTCLNLHVRRFSECRLI